MTASSTDWLRRLASRQPLLWINPRQTPKDAWSGRLAQGPEGMAEAAARLARYAPLLAGLFPVLAASGGRIGSPLLPVPHLADRLRVRDGLGEDGVFLVKADHDLPVAGSIKARGGFHAVLAAAERLALEKGVIGGFEDDGRGLAGPRARELFAAHTLTVGSTGNLGLSIGVLGAALGFQVAVHMSRDAKEWKKDRLRGHGVTVVEHDADYTAACRAVRQAAAADPRQIFIDDENSLDLFYGYAAAAAELAGELRALNLPVGPDRPLFLYLPCGVGGAPGGVTFGARHVFGDAVHCFTAEPVEAPALLYGLISGRHGEASVSELGLAGATEADGLAVGRPSRFVGRLMEPLLAGGYTVTDNRLLTDLLDAYEAEGLEIEPSAAAGFSGPGFLSGDPAGAGYLRSMGLDDRMDRAVHVLWSTGGSLVPAAEHEAFRQRARQARDAFPNRRPTVAG